MFRHQITELAAEKWRGYWIPIRHSITVKLMLLRALPVNRKIKVVSVEEQRQQVEVYFMASVNSFLMQRMQRSWACLRVLVERRWLSRVLEMLVHIQDLFRRTKEML